MYIVQAFIYLLLLPQTIIARVYCYYNMHYLGVVQQHESRTEN